MEKFKNLQGKNIYFIGIGGISMSSLAQICLAFGATVSGSDLQINDEVKKLSKMGALIFHGHSKKNISKHYDYVVFSGAVKNDNVEYVTAKKTSQNLVERSEFLGIISEIYGKTIAISGTHGKTTTTALVAEMLIQFGLNPTVHIGGETSEFGNVRVGNIGYFVTEGCEYRNSIRFLKPQIGLVTNIELDHTDYYKNYTEIENAFLNFAENVQEKIVVFENNEFAKKINSKSYIITAGFGDGYDVAGKNLVKNADGTFSFDVFFDGYIGRFRTNQIGLHNAKNALSAVAVGLLVGVDYGTMYRVISTFKGVKRRMEKIGEYNGVPVICDYAHHPSEIKNSISSVKLNFNRVLVVFQPHTFSRTIGLKTEFKKCFASADGLVIFKTYPAREKYIVGGSAKELFNEIPHKSKEYCDTIVSLKSVFENAKNYDVILILGAGDIYEKTLKVVKSGY